MVIQGKPESNHVMERSSPQQMGISYGERSPGTDMGSCWSSKAPQTTGRQVGFGFGKRQIGTSISVGSFGSSEGTVPTDNSSSLGGCGDARQAVRSFLRLPFAKADQLIAAFVASAAGSGTKLWPDSLSTRQSNEIFKSGFLFVFCFKEGEQNPFSWISFFALVSIIIFPPIAL